MKQKKGKKASELTSEQKAALKEQREGKLAEERERKENENYEKYISNLRQENYRAALLSDVLKSKDAMRRAYQKEQRSKLELRKWNEYVSCSKLPNINDPPAMREFIYRWKTEIREDSKTSFSWVLDVDEYSVLTQDLGQKNQCFWKLLKGQPNVANQYLTRIEQCLSLLSEMDLALLNSSKTVSQDIKIDLRTHLYDVLDQITFRVISNIERDMRRIDALTADFNFKSNHFSLSVWTTRPVPQVSSLWRIDGVTEISFPVIEAVILVNSNFTDGFSFRGFIMQFDHFSDLAPSYNLNVKFPPTPDLRAANVIEWNKREEIMQEKLNQMKAEREKWELKENIRLGKEEENRKQTKKGNDKINKQIKLKAGPPIVTERTIVDVEVDYLNFEDDIIKQENLSMSVESLNLTENEINLREFRIFGGVYSFNYIVRPEQYNQLKFQFLYKIDMRHILKFVDFVATEDEDLIQVVVKLSENVSWWLTPTVCYWEPWEKSTEFLSLSPELQDFHLNYNMYKDKLENLLFSEPQPKLNYNIVKIMNDFQLDTLPYGIDFKQLIQEFIAPRIPITFKFQMELDAEKEKLRKVALREKEAEMEKIETQQKRQVMFDNKMKEYLVQVKANIDATLAKMQSDFEEFCDQQRNHLMSIGENELQISRFLKHKKEVNDKNMKDFEIKEMEKFNEYIEDQFTVQVLDLEAKDETIITQTQSSVGKTSPRDLFINKFQQMPLKVIDSDHVYNFDVPNENDAPGYEGDAGDNILLSTFLRYLNVIFEKMKPIFNNKPLEIEKENAQTEEDTTQRPSELQKKISIDLGKKPKSLKTGTTKSARKVKSKSDKSLNPPNVKQLTSTELVVKSPPSEKIMETPRTPRTKKLHANKILHLVQHFPGKWVRIGTKEPEFDPETREIKFQISRFGIYGFAMPKYMNLPLTYWEVYPNTNKKHSIMMKVIGQYCEIKLEIDEEGFFIERLVPNNINFVPNKTAMEYRDLLAFLQDSGFNIFADRDASIYVQGVSEKHRSMEDHTYFCIAQFTLSHYFRWSAFNRLLDRRMAVFELYEKLENDVNMPDNFTEVLVTPQKCNLVKVLEKVGKTGERYLDCKIEPENQEYYPDVYNLLMGTSNELSLRYHEQMKHGHRFNVAILLCAVRPLSFD